jgi:hypothetical protein
MPYAGRVNPLDCTRRAVATASRAMQQTSIAQGPTPMLASCKKARASPALPLQHPSTPRYQQPPKADPSRQRPSPASPGASYRYARNCNRLSSARRNERGLHAVGIDGHSGCPIVSCIGPSGRLVAPAHCSPGVGRGCFCCRRPRPAPQAGGTRCYLASARQVWNSDEAAPREKQASGESEPRK